MDKLIKKKLLEIETKENVIILHAVESGSRAWGFASPDSDFDVRFIYLRPLHHYLKLERTRDVIEWQLDDTLDINGWDLQKALGLLHNSNPTLFEWNNSPIIYKTTNVWGEIKQIVDRYFQQKPGLYHYLSTAKKNYREYLKGDMVKAKKYFYVIRPILACKWILENNSPPPMLFSELVTTQLDKSILPEVNKLLDYKINQPEIAKIPKITALNKYIESNLELLKLEIDNLPSNQKPNWDELNQVFYNIVTEQHLQ